MSENAELIKKLGLWAGARVWLVNAPQDFAEMLTAGAEIEPVPMGEDFDGAIAFCANQTEAETFARQISSRLPEGGPLWLTFSGKADGTPKTLAEKGFKAGETLELSSRWTATRFSAQP
jgi:hypothetical protein